MAYLTKNNKRRILLVASLILLPYLLLMAGSLMHPFELNTSNIYSSPSQALPFGSDALGRDLFARTIYASGLTLHAVLLAVIIALSLGLFLGTIAGYYYRRWPDIIISWFISLIFSVPFIMWVIGLLIVLGGGLSKAFIVIGCLWWVGPARLVRSEVISLRTSLSVTSDRALGFSEGYIFIRNILPRSYLPALLSLIYYLPELISLEVALSFFGLGAEPPTPSLGQLIFEGVNRFYSGWWLSLLPAVSLLLIVITVYTVTYYIQSRPQTSEILNV